MVVFGEELSTKRVKMGLFTLSEQDVGWAKIMSESYMFVKKKRG